MQFEYPLKVDRKASDGTSCFAQQIASVPSVAYQAVLRCYSCRTSAALRSTDRCGKYRLDRVEVLSLLAVHSCSCKATIRYCGV